jgi:hypothetical protein
MIIHTSASSRHEAPELLRHDDPPKERRAQGKPGARCTRGLACKCTKQKAHEHTGSAEASRLSLRGGLRLIARSPR